VDFPEDIDEASLRGIGGDVRSVSRLSFSSDGSSVPTECDSGASVCTPPPIRTRAGEASKLRLRCMLSRREKYAIDPCDWKLAPKGTVQLKHHRSGMVKFINDLRRDFGLDSRVTTRAVSFLDRYVCSVSSRGGCEVARAELCAAVCLLLASKFQEVQFSSISQLLEAISTEYIKQEVKDAELEVLNVLGWNLNSTSPHAALEEMVNVLSEHHGEHLAPVAKHARMLVELSLWDPEVITICPMVVAAAALLVAWSLQLYGADPLPEKISAHVLCDLCDVSADDLARCEGILADLAVRALL